MKIKALYDVLPRCMPVMEKRDLIQLIEDWYFVLNGKQCWIPAGYTFNGASIPRIFWFIIGSPFDPHFWAAALPHDWGYLTHILTRPVTDEMFRQLLVQSGVGAIKARIMWTAVRTPAGALAWRNGAQDEIDLLEVKTLVNDRQDSEKFQLEAP